MLYLCVWRCFRFIASCLFVSVFSEVYSLDVTVCISVTVFQCSVKGDDVVHEIIDNYREPY